MLSFILHIFFGCLIIVVAILGVVKKWKWLLPFGTREISADIIKYTKVMSINYIIFGLIIILIGILGYYTEIQTSWIYILAITMNAGFNIFCKQKFIKK